MKIKIQWEFDLPSDSHPDAHDQFAEAQGVPLIVDMCDYLHDAESASNYQITDALSDEHGWLIQDWEVIESCNSDQTNNIINHQDQQANSKDNNMETIPTSTPTPASNEEHHMSANDSTPTNEDSMITQLFQQFISEGGTPKVTEFKKHLNELINSDIKPLCGRSGKSADGTDWRSKLKARFSGKGAKWVLVPINEINPTITQFEADGINCDNFKTFIELKGAAWIRFAGPRLDPEGQEAAAFEVRTGGSKTDHPKQLHFIRVSVLEETIRPMEGTPHSLKFETLPTSNDENQTEDAEPEQPEANETELLSEITGMEIDTDIVTEPETLEEVFEDFISGDDPEDDEGLNDDLF